MCESSYVSVLPQKKKKKKFVRVRKLVWVQFFFSFFPALSLLMLQHDEHWIAVTDTYVLLHMYMVSNKLCEGVDGGKKGLSAEKKKKKSGDPDLQNFALLCR